MPQAEFPVLTAPGDEVAVELTAVVVAVTDNEPRVLVRQPGTQGRGLDALPAGPLESKHRTIEAGLHAWVRAQTGARLGYVEQLYTFGDLFRELPGEASGRRVLSIGYLALSRETASTAADGTRWKNWYAYFPWEDWRQGRPPIVSRIARLLRGWVRAAPGRDEREDRRERVGIAFGSGDISWSDDRVLERYELLYEAGLVAEARRGGRQVWAAPAEVVGDAEAMTADHRRILATAIGRLRGKIKYRPVVFELMPPGFTLLQLQQAVEALAGLRLHKQNFRRLVEQQGLVEETGRIIRGTGGRPAREVRFRREVVLERLAPGVGLPALRAAK